MRRLFLLLVLIICSAPPSFAQAGDDYHKVEVFGGFSRNSAETKLGDADPDFFGDFTDGRAGSDGFNASVTRNFRKLAGFKVDFSSERLGPLDPAMPPMDARVPAYHARAGAIDWSDREAAVEYAVGAWRILAGSAHPFNEATVRALAAQDFDRTQNMLTPMNHAQLSGGERWFGRLGEVRVPALVIHGTEDPVLPYAHGVALAEALPQATLLTLKGTGHELHRDDWGTIIEAVERHTSPPEIEAAGGTTDD